MPVPVVIFLLSRLQNSNTSLQFWNLFTGLKFLNEFNIKSSLSQNSQYYSAFVSVWPHIYLTISQSQHTRTSPYVTLIKASSLNVTHRSFRHASPHLWNQLPTSLRMPHPNYSSPSQRPSFEHAGLTCYTLLSPSITFSLFHSELKTYLFRKSHPPP